MKILLMIAAALAICFAVSCDVQSEIAKKSVEKYGPTPTPSVQPTPVEEPIDPAAVMAVDTSQQGPLLSVNKRGERKTVNCDKYNQVMVNASDAVVTIKGGCRQVVVNGDTNEISAEAVAEIVFNGTGSTVRYSRYANGKRPIVRDNKSANTVEEAPAAKK